ncbi:MAG: DUF1772 domain-containing protein [Acidimicrobiales bacterium]
MEPTWHSALLLFTIITAGINCGAFFAFSNFVMPPFGHLAPAEGARAMQAINRAAPNPAFMTALMGGALGGVVVAVTASGFDGGGWRIAGGLLALATAAITAVYHVPRNNALDKADADSEAGQAYWARYRVTWTRGNHLRAITSALSLLCLALAAAA